MKKYIQCLTVILCVGFFAGMFSSCVDSSQYTRDWLASVDEGGSERVDRRRTRAGGSRRSKNECEDYDRCKDICDQMLDYSGERSDCYTLALDDIGKIQDVFDLLKKPTPSGLGDIKQTDFELFAEFASQSFARVIEGTYRVSGRDKDIDEEDYGRAGPYSAGQAGDVLDWTVLNKWVGKGFQDFGYGEDIMYNLYMQYGGGVSSCVASEAIKPSYSSNDEKAVCGMARPLAVNYLKSLVSVSQLQEFPAFDLTHRVIQSICNNIDITGGGSLSSSEEYQFCVSYIYACEAGAFPSGSLYDDHGIGQYLENKYKTSVSLPTCNTNARTGLLKGGSESDSTWISRWKNLWD